MNKQIIAALMAAGFCLSAGVASAAGTPFTGNIDVADTDCALLSETVTLGVSKSVHGAYACDETLNLVQVAACHEGGSRAQGAACVDLDTTDGDATGPLPAGCTAVGEPAFSTIPDFKAFYASSQGGVMAEYALGGRCDDAKVAAVEGFD